MMIFKIIIVCCVILSMNIIVGAITIRDKSSEQKPESDEEEQKFYEVDAFGDDYADFGALTGPKGAFSWHANYPLEN